MIVLEWWKALALAGGIYIVGGMVGFLTCAFFVGANSYKWRR